MKLSNILIFGGLAYIAYQFIKGNQSKETSQPSSPMGDFGSGSFMQTPVGQQTTLVNGPLENIQVSERGLVTATDIYKGRPSISQAAQVYNLQQRYGINTPMELNVGGDPLITRVQTAGGDTHLVSRRPANESERNASRLASLKDLASRNPDYTKTVSYQTAIKKLTGA